MDKKLLALSALFFLTFLAFTAYVFSNGALTRFTRASEDTDPSLQTSLVFAWPLSLPADGTQTSEVTVFVRNEEGKGLVEQPTKISTTLGTVAEGEVLTDTDGRAVFHVSSDTPGTAEIAAFAGNRRLLRTITIQFE